MTIRLARRAVLLVPFALAACGGEEAAPVAYPRLDYSYLPQLRLNVARVAIEQHFIPSDIPPSVSRYDPASPTAALRRMGEERLGAFGSAGKAVYVITDAALTREGDTITGTFAVRLEIYTSAGTRAGFAEASVSRQIAGSVHNLSATLYQLTQQIMARMNVEFEYQVRRALGTWLLAPGAAAQPVTAAPISGASVPPASGLGSGATGSVPTGSAPTGSAPAGSAALAPIPLVPVAPPVLPPGAH